MRTYDAIEIREVIESALACRDYLSRTFVLKKWLKEIEGDMISDGLCPVCGGEIDFYRDEYGEYIECPECGWKEE